MTGRGMKRFYILIGIALIAAIGLAMSALRSTQGVERDLIALRSVVTSVARREAETAQKVAPISKQLESVASQIGEQAKALEALRHLEARVTDVEGRAEALERIQAEIEAASAEPEALFRGETETSGSFVILKSGVPIGAEAFGIARSEKGVSLLARAEIADGVAESIVVQAIAFDALLRPVESRVRFSGSRGEGRVEARVDGRSILVSQGGETNGVVDLGDGDPFFLSRDLASPYILLARAMTGEGDLQTGSKVAAVLLPYLDAISTGLREPRAATLESTTLRDTAARYDVEIGDETVALYVYEGNVVAVERPADEWFAYRSDLFPMGVTIRVRTFAELALPEGIREEETSFSNAGQSLAGVLTFPATAVGQVPMVLLLPDVGPFDRNGNVIGLTTHTLRSLAHRLALAGIASFRYDTRGVGRSGGSYAMASLSDLTSDARVALIWLSTVPGVDPTRVAVLGYGMGGVIAAALGSSSFVQSLIVLETPGRMLEQRCIEEIRWRAGAMGLADADVEMLIERERQFASFVRGTRGSWADVGWDVAHTALPWISQADYSRRSGLLSLPLLRDALSLDPAAAFAGVAKPVLILQGDKNPSVLPEDATLLRRAIETGGNENASLALLTDMNGALRPHPADATASDRRLGTDIDLRLVEMIVQWIGPVGDLSPGGTGQPSSRT